jgi:hypothetical protein
MKTPLPEKLSEKYPTLHGGTFTPLSEEAQVINQLITYLAELTEVVERKRTSDEHMEQTCSKTPDSEQITPSPKEQLLWEIEEAGRGEPSTKYEEGFDYGLEVAKAIINRVLG